MLAITLHDLRFRARQFVIAVVGAGLVFAMALLLSGLAAGLSFEIDHTVAGMHVQDWVVAKGSSGRLGSMSPVPASLGPEVAQLPGVRRASPVAVVLQAAQVGTRTESVVLVGAMRSGLGWPTVIQGRAVRSPGEAVVDQRLGLGIGRHFRISGTSFTVVGTVEDMTLLGGVPNTYVSLSDAQAAAFGGRPLVSAFVVRGAPQGPPPGLAVLTDAQVEAASLDQMSPFVSSIGNSRSLMWVIAAIIVAALVYVSALERTRDFAVLKALGSSSSNLFFGLAVQAVLVALAAAALAAVLVNEMTGVFKQPVHIPASAFWVLPASALVVGLLSSLVALRRAVSVDPAAAFSGA